MTQVARPASDVSTGNWSPTPVYAEIDEESPHDPSAVTSGDDPAGDAFEVMLSAVNFPADGQHTLTVRLKKAGSGDFGATILLLQGTDVIAFKNVQPSGSFVNETLVLTPAEVSRITNYGDLRLRVTAGYTVTTGCCTQKLPERLHAVFSDSTGDCSCLEGTVLVLTNDPGLASWTGTTGGAICGLTTSLTVSCISGNWVQGGMGCVLENAVPDEVQCDPLVLTWTDSPVVNCCSGTVTLTVRAERP